MGRLSLRDCKASFLRAMPSALVPWDFLRLSWKPVTPGDDSSPCSLLVGSKDTGESGQSDSGPFWQASTLLFISRLPSSFGTSLMLLLVAGKGSFTELHFKSHHLCSHLHPKTMHYCLYIVQIRKLLLTATGRRNFIEDFWCFTLKDQNKYLSFALLCCPQAGPQKSSYKISSKLHRGF